MPEATQPVAAPAAPAPEAPAAPVVPTKPGAYKGVDWDAVLNAAPSDGEEAPPPAEAAAATEAAPTEEPKPAEPEKKPEPLAKAFAELSKREEKFRQTTKQKEAEFKAREADLAAKQAAIQDLLEDPLSHLEKLGITYDTLTEQLLNGKKPPPDLKHRAELKKQADALESLKKEIADREAERVAAAKQADLERFRSKLVADVTAGGEKFELINALGEHGMVFDLIDAHAEKTGQLLPTDEAAAQVEAWLEERQSRALTTKKLQSKILPKPAPQPASGGQSAIQGRTPKPLTAATATAVAGVSEKPLTDAERRAKARVILESGSPD